MLGWLLAHNTGIVSVAAIEDAISKQIEYKLKCVFLTSKGTGYWIMARYTMATGMWTSEINGQFTTYI